MRSILICSLASLLLSHLGFAAMPDATDPKIRDAAQRGVNFLSKSTAQWVTQNNCFGCHVEAVTLEGLAVGKSHQYSVSNEDLKLVLKGILDVPGGARTAGGVSHSSFTRTARGFAGAAFARYDELVDSKLTDDLLNTAKQLLAYQLTDGSVQGDYSSFPVAPPGVLQMTLQAAQTWRQAFGRTGDTKWQVPLRNAEAFFMKTAKAPGEKSLSDSNYLLLGLMASGVSSSDDVVASLVKSLRKAQGTEGGWSFNGGGASEAFATGQTVYALRQAGLSETDDTVSKGLKWLVAHQGKDGSWGASGSGKAEAMWAVMGLVSVDVMAVSIAGAKDGAYVDPSHQLTITASDNKGGTVAKLELAIDDIIVAEVKKNTLTYTWKTETLSTGKHTIDGIATNEKGQKSRRRIEVFAGDIFFSQLGTRFTNEGTQVTFRGVHPTQPKDRYLLKVQSVEMKNGTAAAGATVFESSINGALGPLALIWSGKSTDGKKLPGGRYFAELSFVDANGKTRQSESALFMHANEEEEQKAYGKVSGSLGLKRDGSGAANADLELVDDSGRVVQRTTSNEQGNYMFKTVDPGKYKVRMKKAGFADKEIPVQAAPAAESKANSVW